MRQIEESIDRLRRTGEEMARGLSLMTQAGRMGGFGILALNLETGELWMPEGAYRIPGFDGTPR